MGESVSRGNIVRQAWLTAIFAGAVTICAARGQTGLVQQSPAPDAQDAATAEEPGVTAAAPATEIAVEGEVTDKQLRATLERLLARYPGVREARVSVSEGVVELEGHVSTEEIHDGVTQFVRRVQGTRLVLNRMRTDQQVLSAWQLLRQTVGSYAQTIGRSWMLVVLAIVIVVLTLALIRVLSPIWDFLFSFVVERDFVRAVIGLFLNTLILLGGLMLALSVLGLTRAVLSVIGVAGIIGLTLGFAFRDIAENFIASLLLGVRRPFRAGDLIEVAGRLGVVRAMNMRATVLVTFEGDYVRIPNSTIYKEVLVNHSAGPQVRGDFEIVVGYDLSLKDVVEGLCEAVSGHPLVRHEPVPQVLIDQFGTGGIHLRVYYWYDPKAAVPVNIRGEVMLRARVALTKMEITPPPTIISLQGTQGGIQRLAITEKGRKGTPETKREQIAEEEQLVAESQGTESPGAAEAMSAPVEAVSEEGSDLLRSPSDKDSNRG